MRTQDVSKRVKNFDEVALGFTAEEAIQEATRCLQCKKPLCISGCPVEVDIPEFILAIREGKFDEAVRILKQKNSLPAVCGRVCPQEDQCEKECVLGKKKTPVDIGALERFAADYELSNPQAKVPFRQEKSKQVKVGVIGAGPAGLTCAADLAKMGYQVTIFEAFHKPGGVLVYGIPEFRLPKSIIDREVEYIKSLGVDIQLNMVVGKSISIDRLRKMGFKAFFIGTGAGLPRFLMIPGENLNGVYSANEFLTRINLMKAYLFPQYDTPVRVGKKVAVIGAGNVAMDAARSARRLGAEEVIIVYRRTEEEMPARKAEIEHAKEEGVRFEILATPVKILGTDNGWVRGLQCVKNRLTEPDESGRRKPEMIQNSEFILNVDTVICALGQGPNPLLLSKIENLKLGKHKNIEADQVTGVTSVEDIFAGGDIVTGSATVIQAMGAGRRAARSIDQYLSQKYNEA